MNLTNVHLNNSETLEFKKSSPHRLGRGWRVGVIVLGMILIGATCGIIGLAFVQGSWWYTYGTDRPLDQETRARVEAIRDEVDTSGLATEAVMWLDAAMEPNADPTAVRFRLIEAQEILEAVDDLELTEATKELRAIIQTTRSATLNETVTPRTVSLPE